MNALKEINLADLRRTYFEGSSAPRALRILQSRTPASLCRVLRHHDEGEISDRETWERDAFDYLLGFYSAVEIASLMDIVPEPLPMDLVSEARRTLTNPAISRYYQQNYPLLLPQLFSLRISGHLHMKEASEHNATIFMHFLSLDSMLDNDEVETFQWFIDGGCRGGYDIDDTLAVLKSPKRFFTGMTSSAKQMTSLQKSVAGFRTFLIFCRELDALLGDEALPRMARFELWHYFAYWFSNLGAYVGKHMEMAIRSIASWSLTVGDDSSADRKRAVEAYLTNIDHLISGGYGILPDDRGPSTASDLAFEVGSTRSTSRAGETLSR
jgi:hypothetical protein